MPTSAGILLYRFRSESLQLFLVHPGGPLFKKKDYGSWSIPKGLVDPGEDHLETAVREFSEETGFPRLEGPFLELGSIRQKGGKVVEGWAVEGDCDPDRIESNRFEMEWPPRSGRMVSFPEVDRAAFFESQEAKARLNPAQAAFVDRLLEKIGAQAKPTRKGPRR